MLDIVIPFSNKDNRILPITIKNALKFVQNVNRIFIISKDKPDLELIDDNIIIWKSENSFPDFNFDTVKNIINIKERTGWYFQQLIKMYAWKIIDNLSPFYMVLDSDVVFYKTLNTFNENGLPYYNTASEYHVPYFEHMKRLHPDFKKVKQESGICHYMIFKQEILKEIMNKVEELHKEDYWKVFLNKANEINNFSGASEYELYFNYINHFYKDEFVIKKLYFLNLSPGLLSDQRTDCDYVGYHAYIN